MRPIKFDFEKDLLDKKETYNYMKINLDQSSTDYTMFVDVDTWQKVANEEKETTKKLMEEAKVKFNDNDIYRIWSKEMDRDTHTFSIGFSAKTKEKINVEPGVYDLVLDHYGSYLYKTNIEQFNKILPIHTDLKDLFEKVSFKSKNNILVYGEPGNGKTQSITSLS